MLSQFRPLSFIRDSIVLMMKERTRYGASRRQMQVELCEIPFTGAPKSFVGYGLKLFPTAESEIGLLRA